MDYGLWMHVSGCGKFRGASVFGGSLVFLIFILFECILK